MPPANDPPALNQDLVRKKWHERFSEYDIVRHWFVGYYEIVMDTKRVVVQRSGNRRRGDVDQPL